MKYLKTYQLFENIINKDSLISESKKPKGSPAWHDSDEPDANGKFKTLGIKALAAWKTGHRPGISQQAWAHARVNSFVTKSSGTWGKADKDLAQKVRKK